MINNSSQITKEKEDFITLNIYNSQNLNNTEASLPINNTNIVTNNTPYSNKQIASPYMELQMKNEFPDNIRNYPFSESRVNYNINKEYQEPYIYQQKGNENYNRGNIPMIQNYNPKFQIIDDKIVEIKENNNTPFPQKENEATVPQKIDNFFIKNKKIIGIIIAVIIILVIIVIGSVKVS